MSLGTAFENLSRGLGMAYFPAISLSFKESVAFNFGSRPLRYPFGKKSALPGSSLATSVPVLGQRGAGPAGAGSLPLGRWHRVKPATPGLWLRHTHPSPLRPVRRHVGSGAGLGSQSTWCAAELSCSGVVPSPDASPPYVPHRQQQYPPEEIAARTELLGTHLSCTLLSL